MDADACYAEMSDAMRDGDDDTARFLALSLKAWFARGGFCPSRMSKGWAIAYANNILRRTAYLGFA